MNKYVERLYNGVILSLIHIFQSENNGCVDFVGSEDEIMEQIRQLVCMLPSNNEGCLLYTSRCV